jgi:hypothetical protein
MSAFELFRQLKSYHVKFGSEKEWAVVYSAIFEMADAPYTTFVKLGYFRKCKGPVARFQDIPSEFKVSKPP